MASVQTHSRGDPIRQSDQLYNGYLEPRRSSGSLLGLTAHRLDDGFIPHSANLNTNNFCGSHASRPIAAQTKVFQRASIGALLYGLFILNCCTSTQYKVLHLLLCSLKMDKV